jgi:hypothetical protein
MPRLGGAAATALEEALSYESTAANSPQQGRQGLAFYYVLQVFLSALGRTRTCDLLIRSPSRLKTQEDTGGQGEPKPRVHQVLGAVVETGRDREGHGVVVALWYARVADPSLEPK